MRDSTVICAALVSVGRSATAICGAIATVAPVLDAAYQVPMNGVDIGVGVNAPDDSWAISLAAVSTGTLSIDDQLLLYTPDAGYTGPAEISYVLTNGSTTIPATITLAVIDPNPIAATDDIAHVLQDSVTVLAVKLNDLGNVIIISTTVDVGTVRIVPAGIEYTTQPGYTGPYLIQYETKPI